MEDSTKPVNKRINPYLVLGVSLATNLIVIALILIIIGLSYLFADFIPYGFGTIVGASTALAVLAISIGVPLLRASRQGWRNAVATIITTLVMQLFILMFTIVVISAIFNSNSNNNYRSYGIEDSPLVGASLRD